MREFFLNVLKWSYRVIKYTFIISFSFYIFTSINGIKKDISILQNQNLEAYDINAEIYSQLITAINIVVAYAQEINNTSVDRDITLVNFLQDLDNKIKAADEASLNRDKIIATHIEQAEQKPAYDYIKSMTVYLIEQMVDDDTKGSIGTGTVIKVTDNETFILTNNHVCDWAENSICYVYQNKIKYQITSVKKSEVDHDMQVVKTSVLVPGKQAVKGIKDVVAQDKVYMTGNNNGNPFMYSEGTVSGFMRGTGDLLVGMPSGPGNSGSGIFTQDGYLAGLLYAGQMFDSYPFGAAIDTSHGICVRSEVLRLFLAEYFN